MWTGPRVSTKSYTSNEGWEKTTRYERYILVGVPKSQLARFLLLHAGAPRPDHPLQLDLRADLSWFTDTIRALSATQDALSSALVLAYHALQLQLPAAAVQVLEAFPGVIAARGSVPQLMKSSHWPALSTTVYSILDRIPVGPRVELCTAIAEKVLKGDQLYCHDPNPRAPTTAWEPMMIAVHAQFAPSFSNLSNRVILSSKMLQLAPQASVPDHLKFMVASPVFVEIIGRHDAWRQLSAIIKSTWWPQVEAPVLHQLTRLPWPTRFELCVSITDPVHTVVQKYLADPRSSDDIVRALMSVYVHSKRGSRTVAAIEPLYDSRWPDGGLDTLKDGMEATRVQMQLAMANKLLPWTDRFHLFVAHVSRTTEYQLQPLVVHDGYEEWKRTDGPWYETYNWRSLYNPESFMVRSGDQ
ncbi:hypothetical protein GGF32_006359 [Allomyces javanicus]|nr:hypothetical protein GGF32_006359 [Allomyces javanicus]